MRPLIPDSSEQSSVLTIGVTDLMTSVIFILLFSAYVTKVSETEAQTKVSVPDSVPEVRVANDDGRYPRALRDLSAV